MSQAGRATPLPLLPRDLASRRRLQFHIRTPGCDPSAPLRNPRWRLLEAPAGSALAASPPPAGSRPAPAVGASNSALVTDFIATQFREAALPVFISETFKVCKAYFLSSWSSCSMGWRVIRSELCGAVSCLQPPRPQAPPGK